MRKVRACTYALLACVCFFLNLTCERTILPVDSSKKIDYEQADTKAKVTLTVVDMHTKAPIPGAKVSITGIDSSLTDSKGTVIFDSIKPGDYIITCSKTGFEEIYGQLNLTLDPNSNTVPIVNQSSIRYLMAKKGAAVKGNIFYEKNDKLYPANGAIIECKLIGPDGQMFQNPLKTTTSTNGAFIFTNLPEHTKYKITVLTFSDGTLSYTYNTSDTCEGKAAGDTIRADDIVMKYEPGVFLIVGHNLKTLTVSDPIELEFSEAVDTSKLSKDSSITVVKGILSERILIQTQWQNSNKKLIIKPFDGTWSYQDTLNLYLKGFFSIAGKKLGNSNFIPRNIRPIKSGALGNVMNIKAFDATLDTTVNHSTNLISLRWSPLANALNYQIYQKKPIDSSWIFLRTVIDTFTNINVENGILNSGKQIKYIVLGENSTTISPLNTATVLVVKDQMPPRINTTFQRSGFDNTSSTAAKFVEIPVQTSYIPEPMDTTKKPVVKIVEGSYLDDQSLIMYGDTTYKVKENYFTWTWATPRSGTLGLVVDAGKDGSYDTLKIDFRGLTDLAGNKADTTGGAGYITILTR